MQNILIAIKFLLGAWVLAFLADGFLQLVLPTHFRLIGTDQILEGALCTSTILFFCFALALNGAMGRHWSDISFLEVVASLLSGLIVGVIVFVFIFLVFEAISAFLELGHWSTAASYVGGFLGYFELGAVFSALVSLLVYQKRLTSEIVQNGKLNRHGEADQAKTPPLGSDSRQRLGQGQINTIQPSQIDTDNEDNLATQTASEFSDIESFEEIFVELRETGTPFFENYETARTALLSVKAKATALGALNATMTEPQRLDWINKAQELLSCVAIARETILTSLRDNDAIELKLLGLFQRMSVLLDQLKIICDHAEGRMRRLRDDADRHLREAKYRALEHKSIEARQEIIPLTEELEQALSQTLSEISLDFQNQTTHINSLFDEPLRKARDRTLILELSGERLLSTYSPVQENLGARRRWQTQVLTAYDELLSSVVGSITYTTTAEISEFEGQICNPTSEFLIFYSENHDLEWEQHRRAIRQLEFFCLQGEFERVFVSLGGVETEVIQLLDYLDDELSTILTSGEPINEARLQNLRNRIADLEDSTSCRALRNLGDIWEYWGFVYYA